MKEIGELHIPDDRRYARDHEWAMPRDGLLRVGVNDFAQDRLGDVVYVELPRPGARFGAGERFGAVESVKAVSDLFMPVSGTVAAVNGALSASPGLVNSDPYGEGWMIEVTPEGEGGYEALMDRAAYLAMLSEGGR